MVRAPRLPVLVLTAVLAGAGWTGTAGQAAAQSGNGSPSADRLERREVTIIAQLDRLDRRMSEISAQRRKLESRAAELVKRHDRAKVRSDRLAGLAAARRDGLSGRVRALYVHGNSGAARTLAAAPTIDAAAAAWQSLARLVRFDLALIRDYNGRRRDADRAENELRTKKAELAALRAKLDRAGRSLADERRKRVTMLLKLEQQRQVFRATVTELDRTADRISTEAAARADLKGDSPDGGLTGDKGRLPWPVKGRLTAIPGSQRAGVLIRAEAGLPVQAVGRGRVVFAGWVSGFGQVVIVDHGSRYYTLSGHLEELQVREGERVSGGSILGLVGRAGVTRPGVYFEIRHRDRPVNPRQWLARGG